jgi:hypothetical protein
MYAIPPLADHKNKSYCTVLQLMPSPTFSLLLQFIGYMYNIMNKIIFNDVYPLKIMNHFNIKWDLYFRGNLVEIKIPKKFSVCSSSWRWRTDRKFLRWRTDRKFLRNLNLNEITIEADSAECSCVSDFY